MVTARKTLGDRFCHNPPRGPWDNVTGMATTRIHRHVQGRLFLREHRVAKGISATEMGGRIGMERESVYRLEKGTEKSKAKWQLPYAEALGIEPERLRWPPEALPVESLDAMVKDAPEDIRKLAADIVRRLVAGGR